MGKISPGLNEIKKISLGNTVIKKVSFGATDLWSDEPWPSEPMFFDDFNSYANNAQLDVVRTEWVDQVYASSGYMIVNNGMVGANATDRAMNCDVWNVSTGSLTHWAAIKVGTLPAVNDAAAWTGVATRHNVTGGGVIGQFTGAAFQIRSGTTSSTSAGTLRAEATFASLPGVAPPAVGDWFGMVVTAIDATNAKYELWLRDQVVLAWTGVAGFTGQYIGIASSGSTAGRIDEWKGGSFVPANAGPNQRIIKVGEQAASPYNTLVKIVGYEADGGFAGTSISGDSLKILVAGTVNISGSAMWKYDYGIHQLQLCRSRSGGETVLWTSPTQTYPSGSRPITFSNFSTVANVNDLFYLKFLADQEFAGSGIISPGEQTFLKIEY